MTDCPCCSNQLLRHVRQHQVYWFCRHCWQEMPVYNFIRRDLLSTANLVTIAVVKKQVSALAID